MDGMGCLVPVDHKDRGEIMEQQALRVPLGHKDKEGWLEQQALRVPLAQEVVGWSTQGGGKLYSCPNISGTELVYAGRAGGTHYNNVGGAANYLCMPDDPDYLRYDPGVQGYNYVYGVEYETSGQPLSAVNEHNVPCAVCYASTRVAVTMIPAKTRCPDSGVFWLPHVSPQWPLSYHVQVC